MILTKIINITITNRNLNYYKKFYTNIKIGDEIDIDVVNLPKNSSLKIKVKCDICGKIRDIIYQYYNRIKGEYCCCKKCANKKRQESLFKKYGVYFPTQSKEIRNKIKINNINKYGVEHNSQREDIKIKKKETTLKNYGVQNPSQSLEIKKKKETTSLLNFGVPYHTQSILRFNDTFRVYLKKFEDFNLHYQSNYELNFLTYLKVNNLINDLSDFKNGINYYYQNKKCVYYPDFFIEKFNLIIEIKSLYWYNKFLEKNKCKKYYCEELGYKYIYVIDNYFDEFINKYYPSKL